MYQLRRNKKKKKQKRTNQWKLETKIYRDACTEKILKNQRLFKPTIFFEKMNSIRGYCFPFISKSYEFDFFPARAKRSIYSTAKNFRPRLLQRSGSDGKVGSQVFLSFEELAFPCNRFSLTTGNSPFIALPI